MATKTVTLNGAEQRVDELGGLNALIINNTTEVLYASAKAGIVPYADGVIEIPPGEAQTLPDSNGTVFLLGSGGRTQLTGIVNFKMPSRRSGGGGVTKAEVNGIVTEKIAEVVADAPEDFDTLKEMSDWISSHEDSAAAMNSKIKANAADITGIQTEQETQNTNISALQSGLSQISNPNLLDNPDFKINQRGQSEYTGAGYTVDRWYNRNLESIIVGSNGIKISDSTTRNYKAFNQRIENFQELLGKPVTLSMNIIENTFNGIIQTNIYAATNVGLNSNVAYESIIKGDVIIPSGFTGMKTITFKLKDSLEENEGINVGYYFSNLSGTLKIEWTKLELGEHATPFVPPHPATELLKCRRYFEKRRFFDIRGAKDTSQYSAMVTFAPKVSIPAVVINGVWQNTRQLNKDEYEAVNLLEYACNFHSSNAAFPAVSEYGLSIECCISADL